ncbi:hypothetical protein AB4099_32585 [Bosea sp. 2KB_26]|uniref:hypothetical protein n=1 Tax=Bosea sp. 2KB_26 TaxID=3237475 RepID=UPI003F924DA4
MGQVGQFALPQAIEPPLSREYIQSMSDEFPDILRSPLCQTARRDGVVVQVEIYRLADSEGWTLELIDEDGGSIVWEETFATDGAALAEFNEALEEIGLSKLIQPDAGEQSTLQ